MTPNSIQSFFFPAASCVEIHTYPLSFTAASPSPSDLPTVEIRTVQSLVNSLMFLSFYCQKISGELDVVIFRQLLETVQSESTFFCFLFVFLTNLLTPSFEEKQISLGWMGSRCRCSSVLQCVTVSNVAERQHPKLHSTIIIFFNLKKEIKIRSSEGDICYFRMWAEGCDAQTHRGVITQQLFNEWLFWMF